MIGERIKTLREKAGFSQAELARRLSTTRASVNAWECGLSAPTAAFIIELSNEFHVSTDFLLERNTDNCICLDGLSDDEIAIIYQLIDLFEKRR